MRNLLNSCSWVGSCSLCQVPRIDDQYGNSLAFSLLFILCYFDTETYFFYLRYLQIFSSSHRNREIKRIKDNMKGGNSFAFLYHDINDLEHSNQAKLPRVSVVMPLKGFGEHNLHNWRSQVRFLWDILLSSMLPSCCFHWKQIEKLDSFTHNPPAIPLSSTLCLFFFSSALI